VRPLPKSSNSTSSLCAMAAEIGIQVRYIYPLLAHLQVQTKGEGGGERSRARAALLKTLLPCEHDVSQSKKALAVPGGRSLCSWTGVGGQKGGGVEEEGGGGATVGAEF